MKGGGQTDKMSKRRRRAKDGQTELSREVDVSDYVKEINKNSKNFGERRKCFFELQLQLSRNVFSRKIRFNKTWFDQVRRF